MNRPKYKQLYLDEKRKIELIFRLCPQAKLLYDVFEVYLKKHALDLERTFIFGEVKNERRSR